MYPSTHHLNRDEQRPRRRYGHAAQDAPGGLQAPPDGGNCQGRGRLEIPARVGRQQDRHLKAVERAPPQELPVDRFLLHPADVDPADGEAPRIRRTRGQQLYSKWWQRRERRERGGVEEEGREAGGRGSSHTPPGKGCGVARAWRRFGVSPPLEVGATTKGALTAVSYRWVIHDLVSRRHARIDRGR